MVYEQTVGLIKSPKDIRDYHLVKATEEEINNLPEEFDLFTVKIKNQGSEPTCGPHAFSYAMEYFYQKQHGGTYKRYSTVFLMGWRDKTYYCQENAACLSDLCRTALEQGCPEYSDCPGNYSFTVSKQIVDKLSSDVLTRAYSHRITGYFDCKSVTDIKRAIYKYGYCIICMPIHKKVWYDKYLYQYEKKGEISGYHGVALYGWDERGFLALNSWGDEYQDKGKFVVPYSLFDDYYIETKCLTDNHIENDDNIVKPTKLVKMFSGIINALINLLISITNKI